MTSQADAIRAGLALYGAARPLCVSEIGSQSCWLHATSAHPRNLYLSGPMGLASSVALGIALTRPDERVLAICGDGSLAMNLSSLVTIRNARPANLCLLVIVNDAYEFTSSLPSPSMAIDWVAAGAGLLGADACRPLEGTPPDFVLRAARPVMLVAKVDASDRPAPPIGMSPIEVRDTFRRALAAG